MSARVYVMTIPGGYIKVGMATDVEARLKNIQTSNPHLVQVVYKSPKLSADNARYLETMVHDALRPYRTRGEWFRVDPKVAIAKAVEMRRHLNNPAYDPNIPAPS